MPYYFADYDTTVNFVTEEELLNEYSDMSHSGFVVRTGKTGENGEHNHKIEYHVKLDSNPEFTGCILLAYARAAYRMSKEGMTGCKTVFDVAPIYLSPRPVEELKRRFL